jgi:hypothetical protein
VTASPSPSGPSGPAGDITRGDAIVLGLFLACWALSLLSFTRMVALAGSLPLTLYSYYGVAVALGWAFGIVYVRRTWGLPTPIRRRFLLIYYLGPPAILGLLRSMAPLSDQGAAPFVPLYAFGAFSILFLVPVTMKFPRPLR